MPSNNTKDDTGPSLLSSSLPSSSHTAFNDEIKLSNNNNSNSNSNSNQSNYDFVDTENQIATQKHEGGGEKQERGLLVNSSMLGNDNDDGNTTTSTSGVSTGGTLVTYPADCYSFLALYHPWENFRYWSFGFIVWMFQVVFLILMIMRVVSKKFSTNPDNDNPADTWLGDAIPSNVPALARTTQFFALLSYVFFADASVKDVVLAVETFPRYDRAKKGDKFWNLAFSSIMRFSQGMLACLTVLILVVTTSDVIDIVLNFTAVNFISGFDETAFELAQWGKYGPAFKAEAHRISELPAPYCIQRSNQHVRYRWTVGPLAALLVGLCLYITLRQNSKHAWHTRSLRVQFDTEQTNLGAYNGCYEIDTEVTNDNYFHKWSMYRGNDANEEFATIGYCKEVRKWYFVKGNITHDACIDAESVEDQQFILAESDVLYDYDISAAFESNWYSTTGAPLDMYFFWDSELDMHQCSDFIGDGICNDHFNIPTYGYDGGDCCASTCSRPNCGVGTMQTAFNSTISFGDGYPMCDDPSQTAITIRIDSLFDVDEGGISNVNDPETIIFGSMGPRHPLMILDCDGSNVLMMNIDQTMVNQTETVKVADGANCTMMVKNITSGSRGMFYVKYTLFHGYEKSILSIGNEPIVIAYGDSYEESILNFQRIKTCFFDKLSEYVNIATIYTANEASNKAIDWLKKDTRNCNCCEDDFFVERYALATINFNNPFVEYNKTTLETTPLSRLWIEETTRQCTWSNVACTNGSITELDLGAAGLGGVTLGPIPTEIGLLTNLNKVDTNFQYTYGTIPSEIGLWSSLRYLSFANNYLTGTIPKEISMMSNLQHFIAFGNNLTGTIPPIETMSELKGLLVYSNSLTGTIPEFLGDMESLDAVIISDNDISGTIPTELAKLNNLLWLGLEYMELDGTIPSALAQLPSLQNLQLNNNNLIGSVPIEIVDKIPSYDTFNVYGNLLSDLIPIEGEVICTATNNSTGQVGEHYCDCAKDCFIGLLIGGYGPNCQCDEALDCCETHFVDNNIKSCNICDEGFTNPDFAVRKWSMLTCSQAATYITSNFELFGTEEQCNAGKLEAYTQGCICPSYTIVPSVPEIDTTLYQREGGGDRDEDDTLPIRRMMERFPIESNNAYT